ncbi:hypothetical protein V8C35DRAFT_325906 [Trichoderma chlorosporum]
MKNEDETLDAYERPIAIRTAQCLESFRQCLLGVSSDHHPREFSVLEDQMARFSTWIASVEALAPNRTSIDQRLRYAREVQNSVAGLLESLDYRIRGCSDILGGLSQFAALNAESGANERLEWCFVDIATEISRLSKASYTIRRAITETEIPDVSGFQIMDYNDESVEPLLLSGFENHIGDRFPKMSKILQQRLARAMLLRHKRILYRRRRQRNYHHYPLAAEKSTLAASSHIPSPTTSTPNSYKMNSASPPDNQHSKHVTLDAHETVFPPSVSRIAVKVDYKDLKKQLVANFQSDTELEQSKLNTESKLHGLLNSDLPETREIACPYCLYALPAQEILDEQKWQSHVKNDLDAYVCIFENCDEPDLLYSRSDDWLDHLHQHNKFWRCLSHRELGPFSTREEYIRHIQEAHNTKFSDTQLRALARNNARKTAKLFFSCPFCGKDAANVDGRLEDHIAEHLISLALKSLPSYQDEISDETGARKSTIGSFQAQNSRTTNHLAYDEDILGSGAANVMKKYPHLSSSSLERPRAPSPDRSPSNMLVAFDDMAPWATYALRSKSGTPEPNSSHDASNRDITFLYPDHESDRQTIIIVAQLSRIIGRKLELHFYNHLRKALSNVGINIELVLGVGRNMMSLRRRLTRWEHHNFGSSTNLNSEHGPGVDEDDSSPGNRIRKLCYILYVYFCYLKRRLHPKEQESLRTMTVWYPDSEQPVEENYPLRESIDGFEEWLRYKDQPEPNMEVEMDS